MVSIPVYGCSRFFRKGLLLCLVPFDESRLKNTSLVHVMSPWYQAGEILKGIANFPVLPSYWLQSRAIFHTWLIQNLVTNKQSQFESQTDQTIQCGFNIASVCVVFLHNWLTCNMTKCRQTDCNALTTSFFKYRPNPNNLTL